MNKHSLSKTPEDISIEARRIEHYFSDDIPRFWVDNNPVLTAFFNALAMLVPEGERFFVKTVGQSAKRVSDEKLSQDIRGFISQEGGHRNEHKGLNRWVEKQGYNTQPYERLNHNLFAFLHRLLSEKHQLSLTLALEHMSALLTDEFLKNDGVRQALHPDMERFYIWHAVEENEHKSVPFDLYQAAFGGYFARIFYLLVVTVMFTINLSYVQCRFLWEDKQLFNVKAWLAATAFLMWKPGWFIRTTSGYFRYFLPSFHPWQYDNRSLIRKWLSQLSC